jgi:hypothetical protein
MFFVFPYCRCDRRELLVSEGVGDICVTLNEEMLFSAHGLDLTLPLVCDFCPQKFNDFSGFDAHMVTHKWVTLVCQPEHISIIHFVFVTKGSFTVLCVCCGDGHQL